MGKAVMHRNWEVLQETHRVRCVIQQFNVINLYGCYSSFFSLFSIFM